MKEGVHAVSQVGRSASVSVSESSVDLMRFRRSLNDRLSGYEGGSERSVFGSDSVEMAWSHAES